MNTDMTVSLTAIPGPPSTPWLSFVSRESLTVCWNEPVTDGGNPVFGYHLQMKERSSLLWQKVNKMPISGNQWRVTNVCPGLIYEFKVAAENAAGVGKMSKTSEEVLAIDACGTYLHLFSPTSCLTTGLNNMATRDILSL